MTELPPYLWFFLAAAACLPARGVLRASIALLAPVLGLWSLYSLGPQAGITLEFLGYALAPVRVDALSSVFAFLFLLASLVAVIYTLHTRDNLELVAGLCYAGSAIGAVLAGDLLTLFVFWELLALTSVFLVWARRTPRANAAGLRYLVVQVLSGVLLLAGTIAHWHQHASLVFDHIGLDSLAGMLIFFAFGIKAAFPLLHSWLVDAYPEATPAGSLFLSVFTTKAAIYALARGFAGEPVLIYTGAVMAAFPIFYAVIENDLRRVLSYSLINQLGFMVVGIGIGSALALNGAVAHAFSHVFYKSLLFMSMGAVLHMTGRINGSDLGGLYKTMPKTAVLCIIGAASISAFPLFSGFVSKSMVMSALLYEDYYGVWLVLLFASAGVFHHAGIKIPYFAFFAHDSGIRASEPPRNMLIAMGLAAIACIGIGVFPALLYRLLPWEVEYSPYDVTHVLTQLQLLFFSALAFAWLNLRGLYPPELRSVNLDVEWAYRRLLPAIATEVAHYGARLGAGLRGGIDAISGRARRLVATDTLDPLRSTSTALVSAAVLIMMFVLFGAV